MNYFQKYMEETNILGEKNKKSDWTLIDMARLKKEMAVTFPRHDQS